MIAYFLKPIDIAPSSKRRVWMDESPGRFAYLCQPLVIANEVGFDLKLAAPVESAWEGGPGIASLKTTPPATSHFGQGIVTFHVNCLFRTEPGVQLIVGGPLNEPKDGIFALTGIVETSWAVATFTMNWKHTRPGIVSWEAGETFCQIIPAKIFDLPDGLSLEQRPLAGELELLEQYTAWSNLRNETISARRRDLDYKRGSSPGGATAPEGEHKSHFR
jgi:hypothetical protein